MLPTAYIHTKLLYRQSFQSPKELMSLWASVTVILKKGPEDFSKEPFAIRKLTAGQDEVSLYGKLVDVFTCDKFLLPNVSVRSRLVRLRPKFYIIAGDDTIQYRATITKASLVTRQRAINDNALKLIQKSVQHQPGIYNFSEMLSKTFIIPKGQNQNIQENIFNNAPVRRIAIAMNANKAFVGTMKSNPFHYQKFGVREINLVRGNQVIVG